MYIEFEKLLPEEGLGFENMSVHLQSSGKLEFKLVKSKNKNSIKSIDQWTSFFLKLLAIYSEKFPKLVSAVIKHSEIVWELASRRTGMFWYLYDKQVRKDIEAKAIPWGKLHYEYGCWPLHLSNRLLCRFLVPNHNFKT